MTAGCVQGKQWHTHRRECNKNATKSAGKRQNAKEMFSTQFSPLSSWEKGATGYGGGIQ
jgi:hypothetical protein